MDILIIRTYSEYFSTSKTEIEDFSIMQVLKELKLKESFDVTPVLNNAQAIKSASNDDISVSPLVSLNLEDVPHAGVMEDNVGLIGHELVETHGGDSGPPFKDVQGVTTSDEDRLLVLGDLQTHSRLQRGANVVKVPRLDVPLVGLLPVVEVYVLVLYNCKRHELVHSRGGGHGEGQGLAYRG